MISDPTQPLLSRKRWTIAPARHVKREKLMIHASGFGRSFVVGLIIVAASLFLNPAHAQQFTQLYAFAGSPDGAEPNIRLIKDDNGNLYGTTLEGGNGALCGDMGCGTVFKLAKDGTERVLYSFSGGSDGAYPQGVRLGAGGLYGVTTSGGPSKYCIGRGGCGTVFMIAPDGTEKVLYSFTGGSDGAFPNPGMVADEVGDLYGTTSGDPGAETLFELTPGGI